MDGAVSGQGDGSVTRGAAPAPALPLGSRISLARLRPLRLVLLAAGAGALVWGLRAGFERLGIDLPGGADPALHGPLMICGFFGTLISLERAVAAGRGWTFAAPIVAAAGALALIAGYVTEAIAALLAASLLLLAVSVRFCLQTPAAFTVLLAVAAAAWGLGTAAWASGAPLPVATGWWLAFLVLTIAAERIELSRLTQPPRWSGALLAAGAGLVLAGAARGDLAAGTGTLMGSGFLITTVWLLRFDIARHMVRQRGQPRFAAACMLAGYVWLGAAALVLLLERYAPIHAYDAAVHAIAIGFVLSMVFAHAPIILPAITGARVAYTPLLYGPLALLHVAVAARLAGGLLDTLILRQAASALVVLALIVYAVTLLAASLWRNRRLPATGVTRSGSCYPRPSPAAPQPRQDPGPW
jgi:hypothetical protein